MSEKTENIQVKKADKVEDVPITVFVEKDLKRNDVDKEGNPWK